jgi:hypothetical protein
MDARALNPAREKTCMHWKSAIDTTLPWWRDYRSLLAALDADRFPACADLQKLLPGGLETASGHRLRFLPQHELPNAPYERRIHDTGVVATRADNWHDLFNALAWARLPGIKAAMNALHCSGPLEHPPGSRGRLRDTLTLFDECGVIVASGAPPLLEALAKKDWRVAFHTLRDSWQAATSVVIAGHALLEKFLRPYKSMTANALLLRVDDKFTSLSSDERVGILDRQIAAKMLAGDAAAGTGCLAPVPLAGIPGWWPDGAQDEAFYADTAVFRPPPPDLTPAPIFSLE